MMNKFSLSTILLSGTLSLLGLLAYNDTRWRTMWNTFCNSRLKDDTVTIVKKEKNIQINSGQSILHMYNYEKYFDSVLQYIHKKYPERINNFSYDEEKVYSFNEWRYRRKEKPARVKVLTPHECKFTIYHNYEDKEYPIQLDLSIMRDHNNDCVILAESHDCCTTESIVRKLTIQGENNNILTSFIDTAKNEIKDDFDEFKKASKETMRIFYYKKDYWALLSKSPKRPVETIYLKEGQREDIVSKVSNFFSKDTRDTYLSYGIPYKSIFMIYGPPGTGKTSTIHGIASVLDCDLYILPITKEMIDTDLVNAFSYIGENEEKERIIVIEDIDTLFEERKEGDKNNGITLQGFLNCLDGFTCIEGTMLFVTANKPEVLDYALIRSCRIDYKLELGYADHYQTKEMFDKFLPTQSDKFNEFFSHIQHKDYTTAALQEFLFYNRDCEDVLDRMDKLNDIIEKNDPKNFEILKEENKNFYS